MQLDRHLARVIAEGGVDPHAWLYVLSHAKYIGHSASKDNHFSPILSVFVRSKFPSIRYRDFAVFNEIHATSLLVFINSSPAPTNFFGRYSPFDRENSKELTVIYLYREV